MIPLQRFSEQYSATGGLAAEGILNQLGRPNIEPLEVLVREAVQNRNRVYVRTAMFTCESASCRGAARTEKDPAGIHPRQPLGHHQRQLVRAGAGLHHDGHGRGQDSVRGRLAV